MENIIQFLQQSGLHFKRFNNRGGNHLFGSIPKNANYIAQSKKPIAAEHFEVINRFLASKLIVVAFFYRNKFLNVTRSKKSFSSHPFENVWIQCNKMLF